MAVSRSYFTHTLLLLILYACFTHILYACFTHTLRMLHSYFMHILLILYTILCSYVIHMIYYTLLMCHPYVSDALLMLYSYFTDTLLNILYSREQLSATHSGPVCGAGEASGDRGGGGGEGGRGGREGRGLLRKRGRGSKYEGSSGVSRYMCVLILLYICVLIYEVRGEQRRVAVYVCPPSCCYMCVFASYCCICVLILVYTCSHTTICVSSYCYV